jgi:hypothetical protein
LCSAERNSHETFDYRNRSSISSIRHVGFCPKRSAERPRFHDGGPRGELCYSWHVADHGKLDEAEPKRKWNIHLRRRDANGDQGRDKMPDSSQGVRPLGKQNKPDKM